MRSRLGRQGGIKKGRGEKARLLLLGPVGAEVKGDGEYSSQGQGRMHFCKYFVRHMKDKETFVRHMTEITDIFG